MDEHGGFVLRQVVETRVEDHVLAIDDHPRGPLRLFVDGSLHLLYVVVARVVVIAADDAGLDSPPVGNVILLDFSLPGMASNTPSGSHWGVGLSTG